MPKFSVLALMKLRFPTKIDKTLTLFILIAITGFVIRLYNLAQNPLDFDESIHAFTSFLYFENGIYRYNPNTHGPFLYYMTSGIFHLLGDSIFSARLLPALFGGSMVLLLLPLRQYLGDVKFLLISGMLAFSYSFIEYSRQIRHDIFLSFFIFAFIVCMILFFERHSKSYLYSGFASLAITMAIKPTTYVFMFILIYFLILNKNVVSKIYESLNSQNGNKVYTTIIYILAIFVAVNYIFYNKISDGFLGAINNWVSLIYSPDSNLKEVLFQPYYYYLLNIFSSEFLIFFTGLIGCIYYIFLKDKNYFILFCSFWAILSLLIFSAVKYKTPDLILNILLPFIIVSGFFLGEMIERFFSKNRLFFTVIIISILLISIIINFPLAARNNNKYEDITQFIKINKGDSKEIYFSSDINNLFNIPWPLPWYLREYNLFLIDGHNILYLNYKFDAKYQNNFTDFVHTYEKRGIIIASRNLTSIENLGLNNSKHFEYPGVNIYY